MDAGVSKNSQTEDLFFRAFIKCDTKVCQQRRVKVRQITLRCSNPTVFGPYYKVSYTILESTLTGELNK